MEVKPSDVLDSTRIYGFVRVEKVEKALTSQFNIKYLEKVIKIMKQLDWEHCYVSVNKNRPIVFRRDKNSKEGIAIAPRVD